MVPPGVNQPAFFRTVGLGSRARAVSRAAALTDGRILVTEASTDRGHRVLAAPQQFVIGRDGTL